MEIQSQEGFIRLMLSQEKISDRDRPQIGISMFEINGGRTVGLYQCFNVNSNND